MKQIQFIFLLFFIAVLSMTGCKEKNEAVKKEAVKTIDLKESVDGYTQYTIDTKTSYITYIGSKPTGKHNGKFYLSKGNIYVNNQTIVNGDIVIDLNSITVDDLNDKEDAQGKRVLINHLKSNDFFDVKNYPKGKFEITSVTQLTTKYSIDDKTEFESINQPLSNTENSIRNPTHIMSGSLELRGFKRSISFPIRITSSNSKIIIEGKLNIDRTDWNITYGEEASITDKLKDKFIYNTVNLGFYVEAQKSNKKLSAHTLAPRTIDAFEKKFGIHKGKRRNHISGICFTGSFIINNERIRGLSSSKIFSTTPLKVIGRFSHKGGVKKDEAVHGEYGMAFQVILENGMTHNFSMNTLDFFPVSTPQGFLQLMTAKISGKEEDFVKLKKDHPEFKNFKAHYGKKPKVLKNYANHQFNSVNTFYLENENGKKTAVRWSFIPRNETISINTSENVSYYKDLAELLNKKGKLLWDMVITIANPEDEINNAAKQWTGHHKTITAATLIINAVSEDGACQNINFDPLQLQSGILLSEDPILKFRSPAYATAFVRRKQEQKQQK